MAGRYKLWLTMTNHEMTGAAPLLRSNSALEGQQLGLALRNAALERYEGESWLDEAREAARRLLEQNGNTPIIIDDVRDVIGPPPRQNMAGPVFAIGCFEFAGYDRSPRPEGHYNRICRWRLSSASAAARGPRTSVVTPARAAAEPAFERRREP